MKTILIVGDEEESESLCSVLASHHSCFHLVPESIILSEIPNSLDLILILGNDSAGSATRMCKEIKAYSMVPMVLILKEASPSDVVDALRNDADDCLSLPLHYLRSVGFPADAHLSVFVDRGTVGIPTGTIKFIDKQVIYTSR
ncbi:hypothetical protein J7E71_12825 [Mesobacillus foraminis]|uniref:hypothetical protein n=1 Tax=Mesobacillus foraminis TaxID=279826 RepID=UPI001BE7E3EF|nr:hypothetical protein [Mesobacillus foraminis]MBT2756834.1 hypothetical protein [Mesobacillus foraminis]